MPISFKNTYLRTYIPLSVARLCTLIIVTVTRAYYFYRFVVVMIFSQTATLFNLWVLLILPRLRDINI